MKDNKKQYWKGVEQLTNDPEFVKYANKEFPVDLPYKNGVLQEEDGGSSRRDFLKIMGFSVAAASLAACEAPVRKAIPYLNKPEEIEICSISIPAEGETYRTRICTTAQLYWKR